MKNPSRNRIESALKNFLISAAPESLKAAMVTVLHQLEDYVCLDEVLVRTKLPETHKQIMELTSVGYDYVRLLRDEAPISIRYSRKYVGATMRYMHGKVGASLGEIDFPSDHYAPVLAYVYWGSVRAWVETASSRKQRPKRFWCNRDNQIAALQRFVERHPDASITTATLHSAGLHALARGMDAEGLEQAVADAGLSRNLKNKPTGFWTLDETIAAYARECTRTGVPLTNHMLAQMGGIGMTIRGNAQTLSGTFYAFRLQVAKLHPWLKPNALCMTSDGQHLDSWQEVAVYELLRRSLSREITMVPHVRLDGLSRCSADLLVGGIVYVEVLMLALEQIASPVGSTEQAYAKKWLRKVEWYRSTNKALVVIEPEDISVSERMAVKIGSLFRMLGRSEHGIAAKDCRSIQKEHATIRPKGYWSFDVLCKIVADVSRAVGGFPTHAQLRAAGYESAPTMLNRYGRHRVSAAIDVPLRNQKAIWTRELVVQQLAACVREHGCLPTVGELKGSGRGRLASAWIRFTNGATNGIAPDVELICGTAISNRRAAPHSYETQAQLAEFLRPICDKLGKFPTRAECREAELSPTVWSTVSLRYGVREMAAMMQVRYEGPRRKRTLLSPAKGLPLFPDLDPGCRPKSKLRRRR